MHDVIVTFVGTEPDDMTFAERDNRHSAGMSTEHVYTKVYRLEFETEDNFLDWLGEAERFVVNSERLTSDIERI